MLPARSVAVTRMVFKPAAIAIVCDQFVLSCALTGRFVTTTTSVTCSGFRLDVELIRIRLMPEGFGCGSTAVPEMTMRFVEKTEPLRGEVMVTTGALVSGNPPGAMRKCSVPVPPGVALAAAIL